MKKRIIVTGGAGFIGANLVAGLNNQGYTDITIVDALRSGSKWKNLVGLQFNDFIHKDDFLTTLATKSYLKDVKAVFHLGACSSTTETNADYLMQNNVQFSIELAKASLKAKSRFVYASSAATYGLGELGYDDTIQTLETLRPLNMYGYSKHLFDLWAKKNKHLSTMCGLKFFNVYGPMEGHKDAQRSMIMKAYEQIRDAGRIKLFKSTSDRFLHGAQMRDFVYVKDCVSVMLWLLSHPKVNGIFNLGTGKARTWNDLATSVFTAVKKPVVIDYIDMPTNLIGQYQDFTEASMKKLSQVGYKKAFYSLEDGVSEYVEYLKSI